MRGRWERLVSRHLSIFRICILMWLPVLSGCHVLVRLSESPTKPAEQLPPEAADTIPPERLSPPRRDPETPRPPLPGLQGDSETPRPPLPELDESRVEGRESSERLAKKRGRSSRPTSLHSQRSTLDRRQRWAIRKRLSGNTGINTNTAIAPGEGQFVYRTQLRFLRSQTTPVPADIDVNLLVNPQVLAYGVRENLSVFGVVPVIKRDGTVRPPAPAGPVAELEDFGVGDMRFFAKYRLNERDEPGETTRLSVFGGMEVPSYDKNFSSDSWDPFLGTVWTYQSLEWGLDLDWFWNFNTGRGVFRYDEMRYDLAYTYVLLTGQTLDDKFWQLNSIFELNGSYLTDGSHLLFAAPGFQLALPAIIVEASLQLPVIREVRNGIEPDYVLIIGTRITW